GAVRTHGRRGRAVEVDVGRLANARGHRHAAIDNHAIHTLASRVEETRDVDDVAELERVDRVVAHRCRQVDFTHADVVEPGGRGGHWSGCREAGLIRGWP